MSNHRYDRHVFLLEQLMLDLFMFLLFWQYLPNGFLESDRPQKKEGFLFFAALTIKIVGAMNFCTLRG